MSRWQRVLDVLLLRRNPLGERATKAETVSQLQVDAEMAKREARHVLERRRLDGYADVRVPR